MESLPAGVDDDLLTRALVDGWGFEPVRLDYVPLGFGSYHWVAADAGGARRFVTVDDLQRGGGAPATSFESLAGAFATAAALRDTGLDFVVAPMPSTDGGTLRPLSRQHTVAVFPYVDGRAGAFGDAMERSEQAVLIELLAALHGATASVRSGAPRHDLQPIFRSIRVIEDALTQTASAWTGGPFSEPARGWLLGHEHDVRGLIERTTALTAQLEPAPDALVVTHGEPHPGNVIHTHGGLVLIDWDTVGLTRPERDLWWWGNDDELVTHYTNITGRAVDPRAIALYRNAWLLADLAVYLHQFRGTHGADDDADHAWRVLEQLLA